MNVYLVSKSTPLMHNIERFLRDEGESAQWITDQAGGDLLPELGGRLCYMSFGKPRPGGNDAYLARIKGEAHGSVLEHTTFGVVITGVSRALTHELIRHRAGMSFSQLSQRYVVHPESTVPPLIREITEWAEGSEGCAQRQWRDWLFQWRDEAEQANERYVEWTQRLARWLDTERPDLTGTDAKKAARQTARAKLPNETETKIMVTGNARAWRTFIEQRGSIHADAEIRELAGHVLKLFVPHAPNLFSDFTVNDDGSITTPHHKV